MRPASTRAKPQSKPSTDLWWVLSTTAGTHDRRQRLQSWQFLPRQLDGLEAHDRMVLIAHTLRCKIALRQSKSWSGQRYSRGGDRGSTQGGDSPPDASQFR